MTNLSNEEQAVLVKALESDGVVAQPFVSRFIELGLAWPEVSRGDEIYLTQAGHIVATFIKENIERKRLETALEKLKEWKVAAGERWLDHEFTLKSSGNWVVSLFWFIGKWLDESETKHASSPDPLTAVIEASKQTPWILEECLNIQT